jgi:hypothetical protein
MSLLRDQVRTARAEYEAIAYPGDLADEVLPAPRRMQIGRWVLLGSGFGAGSLAAAAAIALALVNFLPKQAEDPLGGDMIAKVTGGNSTFGVLSQLPGQLTHLTTYVPVETFRSTLHYFGLPEKQNPADENPTPPPPDRDHAAA